MKIICQKDSLTAALSNVNRAVASKSPILALEGVLLCAGGDTLTLTGYDLEMGIVTGIPADVREEGRIVLSARLFFDMIRRIPSETITLETDEKFLTVVTGGVTQYTILGMNPDDYPELPSVADGDLLELDQLTLKSMIDQTQFAIAVTESTKPAHKGSLFEVSGKDITLVSVDGYRLAIRREPLEKPSEKDLRFIVPGKTLAELSKLIREDDGEEEKAKKSLTLTLSRKHIIFSIDGYSVVSRLLEGEFLDYRTAIPSQQSTVVTISTREFMDSIDRTSLLISDKIRSPLRIRFCDGSVEINCTTSIGKAYDCLDCKLEGEELEIGFNNKYLLDALRASGCDEVRLLMSGPLSPMRIVPLQSEEFLFLVLPVRLKAE